MHTLRPPRIASTARFTRFAPRPLAYADPRSGSPLPPFARARRFLEHIAALAPHEWTMIMRRAEQSAAQQVAARGSLTHEEVAQHLPAMFVTTARQSARDALVAEAHRTAAIVTRAESAPTEPAQAALAAALITSAALALVLRDLLPPELFEVAYAPFRTPVPAASESESDDGSPWDV